MLVGQRRLHLRVDQRVVLVVVLAPLRVPDHHVRAAELGQHRAGDLAGVRAGGVRREVLRAVADAAACRRRPAVCTLRMSVNGGSTTTSTSVSSFSVRLKASFCTSAMASRWLRFIFQLPAISGRRRAVASAICSCLQCGQTRAGSCPRGTPATLRRRWRCARTPPRPSPSARTAAAESPPPTTVKPSTLVIASATPRVPAANGASSNTPIGPFQNTVFAPASALGEQPHRLAGRCPGRASRPGSRRGDGLRSARRRRTCPRPRRRPAARSCRRPAPAGRGRCRPSPPAAASSPTSWPCALRKVKHMPPPMSSLSTLGSSASITASLSETFEPPSTTT